MSQMKECSSETSSETMGKPARILPGGRETTTINQHKSITIMARTRLSKKKRGPPPARDVSPKTKKYRKSMRYHFAKKALAAKKAGDKDCHGMVSRDLDDFNKHIPKEHRWLTPSMVYDTMKYIKAKSENNRKKDASFTLLYMAGSGTLPHPGSNASDR